jgi:N-acetyl-gamma-glutamyl-phosphate reductase
MFMQIHVLSCVMQAVLAPPRRPGHVLGTRLSVGLAGASGYVGRELARLVAGHPALALAAAQARSDGFDDLDAEALTYCDVVFLALPREAGRVLGQALAAAGTPVVDLADGFRLEPGWAYGLTELFRDEIEESSRVANPGCYPTAALLALAPLAEAGLLAGPPVIDGKSGVSGAGATPGERTHFSNVEGGVAPYQAVGHRHIGELERTLARLAGEPVPVIFTPHLAPHSRGLEVTCYAPLREPVDQAALIDLYRERYAAEPFVRLTGTPHPGRLHGANACHLGVWAEPRTQTAIVAGAIDNLVKGAAGQAVQNANLMLGLPEDAGLSTEGLAP